MAVQQVSQAEPAQRQQVQREPVARPQQNEERNDNDRGRVTETRGQKVNKTA